MEVLKILSGVSSFVLIGGVSKVSAKGIQGDATFDHVPVYLGLEAMAQLAALHVRQQLRFQRHAFLLKVNDCQVPAIKDITGHFQITAEVRSQSSSAFLYDTVALGPRDVKFCAVLLIGTRDYDDQFRKHILRDHYQRLFAQMKD